MLVDKDTKLYFSIAEKPGNFGAMLYNRAFEHLGINAIYKPLKVEQTEDFDLFDLLFYFFQRHASGVSVSMPFKKAAARHTICSDRVESIGNANTIKMENGTAWGYNTDYIGFQKSCDELLKNTKTAVVYGTGAVSDSICFSLTNKDIKYDRIHRGQSQLLYSADLLINATPVGMQEIPDNIFTPEVVDRYKSVFDVVVSKTPTNLISIAQKLNKPCISGWKMSLEQLCEQFRIYTGLEAPRNVFETLLEENGYV